MAAKSRTEQLVVLCQDVGVAFARLLEQMGRPLDIREE